jgi:hypothetical protein
MSLPRTESRHTPNLVAYKTLILHRDSLFRRSSNVASACPLAANLQEIDRPSAQNSIAVIFSAIVPIISHASIRAWACFQDFGKAPFTEPGGSDYNPPQQEEIALERLACALGSSGGSVPPPRKPLGSSD